MTLLILLLALALPLSSRGGGLPEPELVLYGTILDVSGGAKVRLTVGTLSWTFQPAGSGKPLAATAVLTNIHDQFSYVIRIPCETQIAGALASDGTLALDETYDRSQVSVDNHPATFVQSGQQTLSLAITDRGRIERVDLEVSIGGALPEWWQIKYFTHNGIDPNDDPDHDGMSNLAEYLAGTDPTDPQSRFAFVDVVADPLGGVRVEWSSVQGKFYTVQRSGDLLSGFTNLQTHIAATSPVNSFRDAIATGDGPYFYRLFVEQ